MRRDADGAAALRREWARWTKVIAGYCRCGWRRRAADPTAYAELHAKVLAACETAAAKVPEGPQHEFYRSLAEMVRPWVSPDVLARTDREMLAQLWQRCHEAECRLSGLRPRVRHRLAPERLLFPLALVVVAAVALGLDELTAVFGGRIRALAQAVWLIVRGLTLTERLTLLGLIVAALALALVRRDRDR